MSLVKYSGKVAVVTGASSGIGKSTAELLVKNGLIVAGLARRVQKITDHAKELSGEKGQLYAFQCDMTKKQEILDTFAQITTELGPITILVNNAGVSLTGNLMDGDIAKWTQIIDTNILSYAIATREAITSMKKNNTKGHIINVNSIIGHMIVDLPGANIYPATKHAITGMTETLRLEIVRAKLPIKLTSLSPGVVKTEMLNNSLDEEQRARLADAPGLEAEDVADAVLYILSTPDHVNVKELTLLATGSPI